MQANSLLLGGIPMIFYGDEAGYTNDNSYLTEPGKSYDNRWMHRPIINWNKNAKVKQKGTIENQVFNGFQKIIDIRKKYDLFSDRNNTEWLDSLNRSVVGFIRSWEGEQVFCLFNYSPEPQNLTYCVFDSVRGHTNNLFDLWSESYIKIGKDQEHLLFKPYQFYVLLVDKNDS
jgi:amylosucrase